MRKFLLPLWAFLITQSLCIALPQSSRAFDAPERVGVVTQTQWSSSTVDSIPLAANPNRALLIIQNTSAASTVTIKFGSAITGTEGIQLSAGTIFQAAIQDSVHVKSSAGLVNTMFLEAVH